MRPANTIPYQYGNNTEPTGRNLPRLKDPIGGQWPSWDTHPNEYVSQIMPTLFDAAEKRMSQTDLRDALRDQFNTRLENLSEQIVGKVMEQLDTCWKNLHGVTAPRPEKPKPEKKAEVAMGM